MAVPTPILPTEAIALDSHPRKRKHSQSAIDLTGDALSDTNPDPPLEDYDEEDESDTHSAFEDILDQLEGDPYLNGKLSRRHVPSKSTRSHVIQMEPWACQTAK